MAAWINRSPLLRCLAIYREMPLRFAITVTLFLIVNGSFAWQQWLIGRAVNEVQHGLVVVRLIDGTLDYNRAWYWLALLGGFALLRGLFAYASGLMGLIIGQDLLFIIRERILVQVQRLDLAYHWRHGIGEIVTRTTRDADKVRDALINFWRQVFETSLVILASVGILYWYSPWLGIIPLGLTLVAISILTPQVDRLVALDRAVGAAYDAVNQDLTEGVHGVRVIKAFGLESLRIERFEQQVAIFTYEARGALAFAAKRIPLPQTIVAMSHVWVLIYGCYLIGLGRFHLGELVASLLVANTLVLRVEGIGSVMQIFADARSSAARIWDLLDAEPQIVSGHEPLREGPLGLRFEHVRVAASGGGNDILRDLSFEVRPGEIVALVGATGSGKSTLMGLLPRLVDTDEGAVLIGSGGNWQDIREIDLGRLRERIHVVPQESFLFSDTLAANLRISSPQAGDDELREALRLASAEEILDTRPEGFETRLGDRGITLSGGQRQRLCLARALLSRPAVLGLDDATSALDAATERRVLENIRGLRHEPGRPITILVVSSRLSTILMADRVLLLADGKIAAFGTHKELSETNADYRDLMGL
jgi:ATP-binding cassette subfamily B protein